MNKSIQTPQPVQTTSLYSIYRNGEQIEASAVREVLALDIIKYLQAVTDDDYSIKPTECVADNDPRVLPVGDMDQPCEILRNGQPIPLQGDIITSYQKPVALDIIQYLQAVTDDEYTLKMHPSTPILIPLYSVYRNGEPIFITGSIQTAYPERIAHDIKHHLEAVTDDIYTIEVIQWVESELIAVPVSHTDKWVNSERHTDTKGA